ncbi:pyridoxal phosphate-dependent transferase [Ampelomyces quisqualis]|uniref:Pyridoxal phosphate-dependent transferase n=1 Tax=Ampelomyces quisqualis TaxID=50730 RepID=A0A6A5QB59_AMPQU|nr:pyridoxal phosphate-dependent transferase [Ampelomyces quisqualis]
MDKMADTEKQKEKQLEKQLQNLLDRRRSTSTLLNLSLPRPGHVDFSSNDFLSLSSSPQFRKFYLQELQKTDLPQGSGGSRLLDGNSAYAEDLEHDIARFHGAQSGLLFNSGFDANAGFFACVPQLGDVIVYDELVHASVHDGMRLSRAAQRIPFMHNSVNDLRRILQGLVEGSEVEGATKRNIFVAVETIYSMDGDIVPLKAIVDAVEEIVGSRLGYVIVDEAHSTGVVGSQGRGLVCELRLEDRIFARLHTFGKALSCNGAIILGSRTLRHYLLNYCRPLIYTTFMSFPSLALIRSSYALLQSGQTVPLQGHLRHLSGTLFSCLQELCSGCSIVSSVLRIPSACPESPIFAIQVQQPRKLAMVLENHGMMVRAVASPTVPLGKERIRVCLHAGNTELEIRKLVRVIKEWCEGELNTAVEDVEIITAKL